MDNEKRKPLTYAEAGVDTDFLNGLKDWAKRYSRSTKTNYVLDEAGSLILDGDLINTDFPNPRWFFETDGIGTKETLLLEHNEHFTAGWDLVASNVNDVIRHGATPVVMTIDVKIGPTSVGETQFIQFMQGVALALKASNCALVGGETAIHRSIPFNDWHLSGTAVGVAQAEKVITGDKIEAGDVILGLGSSGIHTNGTSFAVNCLPGHSTRVLLTESKIYVRPILSLLQDGVEVHGLAHITGEGLPRRIPDILPAGLSAIIDKSSWKRPKIFTLIQQMGQLSEAEMFRVFNMGIGFVVVVPLDAVQAAKRNLEETEVVFEIGRVEANSEAKFVLL